MILVTTIGARKKKKTEQRSSLKNQDKVTVNKV